MSESHLPAQATPKAQIFREAARLTSSSLTSIDPHYSKKEVLQPTGLEYPDEAPEWSRAKCESKRRSLKCLAFSEETGENEGRSCTLECGGSLPSKEEWRECHELFKKWSSKYNTLVGKYRLSSEG